MPEETPQLPISEQETQIQAPSLLEKIQAQKKKILIGAGLFLGILILVGAVFGVYYLGQREAQTTLGPTPTPLPAEVSTEEGDPTANWETYTDLKNIFAIKYPPTLFVQEGPQQTFFTKKEATTAERMDYSDHLVEIMVNKTIQRFESYYQTANNKTVEGYGDLKLRSYKIDGYPAVEYGYNEESKEKELKEQSEALESGASVFMINFPRGIILNKDDTIIEISTKSYFGEFKQTFEQILSTLRFLE